MFSANHRRHLLVAFRHLDGMLVEAMSRLRAAPAAPLFEAYRDDVDPASREPVQRAAGALRAELRGFMERHGLRSDPPDVTALHAVRAQLALAQVNAAELGGRHLRGYGELSPEESAELDALSRRLRELLAELDAVLDRPSPDSPDA